MKISSQHEKFPLLIIGYSRESGIKDLLNSITPSHVESIYLTLDGYKSEEISLVQEKIIMHISLYCQKNSIPLYTWIRDRNLGVAVSIISAVDWFFSRVTSGIILEDDLLLGDNFFDFMSHGLAFLEDNPEVLLVSGDCFLLDVSEQNTAFLTNYPLIWGWGTTSRNWNQIRAGILADRKLSLPISLKKRRNFWKVGAVRVIRGQIDTWDIPVADFMLTQDKFCLFPSVNLVTNNGNDSFAIHTSKQGFPLNLPAHNWRFHSSFSFKDLSSGCEKNNRQLDKNVFKIKRRHSFLGIIFLVRRILGLEKSMYAPLAPRLNGVSIPKTK